MKQLTVTIITFFTMAYGALIAGACNADELYTGAWSYHVEERWGMDNTNHNMLAYASDEFIIGTYKNSYSEQSSFVGFEVADKQYGDFNLRMYGIALYGYRNCGGYEQGETLKGKYHKYERKWCAAPVMAAAYTKYRVRPAIMMLGLNTLAFTIGWDF